ncbi:MAG TPA: RluA family pseudouridine synthase [Chitinophagaceae bacterium]|jgi:23S rRNA pseudouridine955/2504/2580 synthase/23S rRNA pseudouridine1911/1915/1917 synthase|nr:RluA family pseudouridine synthase [Chitinophagaceae bacterium]
MNLEPLVLFENNDFIALNKPPGLLAIPDREGKEISLKVLLQKKYGHIYTVHRIDRDTSGVIIFAKNEAGHKQLSQQFESRQTEKIYYALVIGSPVLQRGSIAAPIAEHPSKKAVMMVHRKGKESLTDYEVLEDFGSYSWVKLKIHTGRTHQIRVHMKEIGHPVVCDELYGDGKPVFISSLKHRYKLSKNQDAEQPILNRLALHAFSLSFTDAAGQKFYLEASLPKDLRAVLQQLEKWKK